MFGMFDWFWNLLYGISKSMYAIIDNMLACANMLCGIEPIRYAGAEMDFISFLLRNQNITYAFVGAVLVGVVLVFIFGVIAIVRTIASEKVDKTPAQIALNVGKTLLVFLFIPAAMALLMFFTNKIMGVLYSATTGGSTDGLGRFLAGAFGQNALKSGTSPDFYLNPSFDYTSTSQMRSYVDLDDYDYFFSWISCIVIILCVGSMLLMFVDRAISLVILFIFSPISLSTSVLDDGARFKLWRDQFIVKFLTGYGCIIAINIYALIIAAVNNNMLVFFDNKILNIFMKILIIVGGGVSMNRVMALVGNLISAGAGSNELRDNAIATSGFRRAIGTPFSATRGAVNFVRDARNTGLSTAIGRSLGFKTSRDYNLETARLNAGGKGPSGAANNKNPKTNASNNSVRNAIQGKGNNSIPGNNGGNNKGGGGGGGAIEMSDLSGNKGNRNVGGQGQNMVNNAVDNALNGKNDNGGKKN